MSYLLRQAHLEAMSAANDARNCGPAEKPVLYTTDADGNDVELALPTRWAVCEVCNGNGTHVNPSIDAGGLSAEDFDEDPDFAESYFAGDYDQTCNKCEGRSTVRIVDEERMSPELLEEYRKQLLEEAHDRAIELAEMRAGA